MDTSLLTWRDNFLRRRDICLHLYEAKIVSSFFSTRFCIRANFIRIKRLKFRNNNNKFRTLRLQNSKTKKKEMKITMVYISFKNLITME